MAPRSKHMAGNNTQQNTRLFSVRNTLLALTIFSSGFTSSGYAAFGDEADGEFAGEFSVNDRTLNEQSSADVAMDADGDFVVTWHSNGQDRDGFGVYGQRFSADGAPAGSEFLVNTEESFDQKNPSIAIDADGDFAVVWQSFQQDGSNYGIYAQLFSPDGIEKKKGQDLLVNSEKTSNQINPSIAMDTDGDFVVVWQSNYNTIENDNSGYGIFGQRFSANGTPLGLEFLVNSETDSDQENPSIAMDADGNFVVVWQSDGNTAEGENKDDSGYGVFGQRFSADGVMAGFEFRVNTKTDFDQDNPDVAMDASGDFIVVWQSDEQDGDDAGIYGQRYNANGFKINDEFSVNMVTVSDQKNPSVAMDADGDFIVTWQSNGNAADDRFKDGVFSRLYNGSTERNELLVNTEINSEQDTPSAAMDADGDFIIVWQSKGNTADPGGYDVFGQRYQGNAETIDLSLSITDGLGEGESVTTGNNFTYTLTTSNYGTGIAMGVELVSAIPLGVTYVSDDAASAGWLCISDASTLVCNFPFMNPGGRSSINVTVKSEIAGTHFNEVTVSSAQTDSKPDNNTAEVRTASFLDASVSSGNGGGGSLGWLSGILFLFALRRNKLA